jgi:uncharacterized protein
MENAVIISPCNSDCYIDQQTNLCRGCFRTIDEIIRWTNLSKEEKESILQKIKTRTSSNQSEKLS